MDYTPTRSSDGANAVALVFVAVFYIAIIAIFLVAYWKIITKAGYLGWYLILAIVPCANFIGLLIFAFAEWPIERELKQWRATGGGGGQGFYPRYGAPGPNQPPYDPPPPSNPPYQT